MCGRLRVGKSKRHVALLVGQGGEAWRPEAGYIPLVSIVIASVTSAKAKRPREMSSFLGIIST
jgi:hypothetical protein